MCVCVLEYWRREGEIERREYMANTPYVAHRQSEFHELALTGRYCRVHLASVQFRFVGYEPIDFPYCTVVWVAAWDIGGT